MDALLLLAWRNIWRHRRRTLINMSAVGLGLFLIITYSGLIGGVLGDAKNQLDNIGMGHIEISTPAWRLKHGAGMVLAAPAALLARLALPPGAEVGVRVVARGLLTSPRGGVGVTIHGIDSAREPAVARYAGDIREGAQLAPDDVHGIVIGDELATRLRVRLGHKVRIMVQRADGEMGAALYRVRGIFHAVVPAIARSRVLVTTAAAEELLGIGDAAHQIVIQLGRVDDAEPVAARLRAELGAGYDVATYGQLLPVLKALEGLQNGVVVVMALFVYLLVGLGILNTTLMSVFERTREFGVMRALGNRPRQIVALVVAEAFWIASVSVAAGLVLGLAVTWIGSEHTLLDFGQIFGESMQIGGAVIRSALRTEYSLTNGLKASAIVYVLTLGVGLYPAWRISRLPPAEALRAS